MIHVLSHLGGPVQIYVAEDLCDVSNRATAVWVTKMLVEW